MKAYEYTVLVEPDDEGQGYTVSVPALPGCVTQGRTLDESLIRSREAITGWIEAALKNGEEVPTENEPYQTLRVKLVLDSAA